MVEIIEGHAVEVKNEPVTQTTQGGWAGDQPVFLIFEPAEGGGNIGIDVDVDGWIESNRETFRRPGMWFLMVKQTGAPVLAMRTEAGDQFFYHRHRVGVIGNDAEASLPIQIIGCKKADGTVLRLHLMPNGLVMTGDEGDVDPVALRILGA